MAIADIAQTDSNAYNMATNKTLEINKAQNSISKIKTELADLQGCNRRNNLRTKGVAEKSRANNLTTYL